MAVIASVLHTGDAGVSAGALNATTLVQGRGRWRDGRGPTCTGQARSAVEKSSMLKLGEPVRIALGVTGPLPSVNVMPDFVEQDVVKVELTQA